MFNTDTSARRRLLRRVLEGGGPDGRVQDDAGRTAVARWPEAPPLVVEVLITEPGEDRPGLRYLRFSATEERPAAYPPELPFLPGLPGSVLDEGGSKVLTWQSEACPVVPEELRRRLEGSILGRLARRILDRSKGGPPPESEGRESFVARVRSWMGGTEGREIRKEMEQLGDPEDREHHRRAFETLVEMSLDRGWTMDTGPESGGGPFRAAELTKGDETRWILHRDGWGTSSLTWMEKRDDGSAGGP